MNIEKNFEKVSSIESRAPTRIDLAGGTVDLWPLYLLLDNPLTLNLGINLFAEAKIQLSPQMSSSSGKPGHFVLRSDDQNAEMTVTQEDLKKNIHVPPQLELHYKLLKFFYEKRIQLGITDFSSDFKLSTRAQSPAGAGLGGSSTLSIAMIGALETWANPSRVEKPLDPLVEGESFIEVVRDVETTVIQVPAGLQDYYGAMYGGLQALRWKAGKHQRAWLPEDLIGELEKRILLFYSGQSRNSGINNWAMYKSFIDKDKDIRSKFANLSAATHQLEQALLKRQWKAAGEAIAAEWATRKTLASGITTPEIDRAFSEASQLTPISGKICGAGGGGCFFVYIPFEDKDASSSEALQLRSQIEKIFVGQGMRPLNFHGVPHGLEVRVNRA
jgi:D-glycero-alpha-D-manno-heptose-7-phosphate kinase